MSYSSLEKEIKTLPRAALSEVIDFIRLVKLKFPEDDTAWEISIKQSKKKLEFEHTVFEIDEICGTAGFKKLPITEVSALIPRPSCRSLDKLRSARTISI